MITMKIAKCRNYPKISVIENCLSEYDRVRTDFIPKVTRYMATRCALALSRIRASTTVYDPAA